MVSDFFLPVAGGIEIAIYSLAATLLERGHKVIVITHSRSSGPSTPRVGIRYLHPSLKIYYLPITPLTSDATLPQYLTNLPFLRNILIRERVEILHGHATLSSMALEGIMLAGFFKMPMDLRGVDQDENGCQNPEESESLGDLPGKKQKIRTGMGMGMGTETETRTIRTVFTDHSLFEFGSAVGILTNKLLAGALRNIDAVVCVSHAGRENTTLRAQLDPNLVSVIPNAIVPSDFQPRPDQADPEWITIVTMTRLVYRKGIDLLVSAAPKICALYPRVRFIVGQSSCLNQLFERCADEAKHRPTTNVYRSSLALAGLGGDGPKMVELEQMREQHLLQDRIVLLGAVSPNDVHSVLNQGQIYLCTSLTEAFGISIIEAASAGLFIVSTKVGGVPEVLPKDMIEFASPNSSDVVRALSIAVETIKSGIHDPLLAHQRLQGMYTWANVAERTERVYDKAMARPERDLFERMSRYLDLGPIFGPILCIITAVQGIFLGVLDWLQPRAEIDLVPLPDSWSQDIQLKS